jgi:hypothetical protein
MRTLARASLFFLLAACAAEPARKISSAPQVHDWKSATNSLTITGTDVTWNGQHFPMGDEIVVEAHGVSATGFMAAGAHSECRITTRSASITGDGRIILLEAGRSKVTRAIKGILCSHSHSVDGYDNPYMFKQAVVTQADGGEILLTVLDAGDAIDRPDLEVEALRDPALAQGWTAAHSTFAKDTLLRVQP